MRFLFAIAAFILLSIFCGPFIGIGAAIGTFIGYRGDLD